MIAAARNFLSLRPHFSTYQFWNAIMIANNNAPLPMNLLAAGRWKLPAVYCIRVPTGRPIIQSLAPRRERQTFLRFFALTLPSPTPRPMCAIIQCPPLNKTYTTRFVSVRTITKLQI